MTPEQYARLRGNLFLRLMTVLARLWQGLGTWHEPDVARFQRDALPVLQGAQRALGQLMAAHVAQAASAARGVQVPPPVVPVENLINVRRGVTVEDEYRRPFEQVWYGLSIGEDVPAATERGRIRLLGLADLDMQVAETQAARHAMEETEAQWWRRTLNGEVNCLLCLMASTQRYWVGDLKGLHPNCDCGIEPQFTKPPADRVIDGDLLKQVYAATYEQTGAAQTDGELLRTLLADMTGVHSEIPAPILVTPRGSKKERARVAKPEPRD